MLSISQTENGCTEWFYHIAPITWAFFAAFIFLFGLYVWRLVRRPSTKHIAPWWTYGIALGLTILSLLSQIVNDALWHCHYTDGSPIYYNKAYQVLRVFAQVLFYSSDYGTLTGLSWLVWLGIYMIPLPRALLQRAHVSTKVPVIITTTVFGIILILWTVATAKIDSFWHSHWDLLWSGTPTRDQLWGQQSPFMDDLWATYITLVFVATVGSSGLLIFAVRRLRRVWFPMKGLKIWLPFTIIFAFESSLLSFVLSVLGLAGRYLDERAIIVVQVLRHVFVYAFAVGLLFTASSSAFVPFHTRTLRARDPDGEGGERIDYF